MQVEKANPNAKTFGKKQTQMVNNFFLNTSFIAFCKLKISFYVKRERVDFFAARRNAKGSEHNGGNTMATLWERLYESGQLSGGGGAKNGMGAWVRFAWNTQEERFLIATKPLGIVSSKSC